MIRPEDFTTEEKRIMGVCEACRVTLMGEDWNRFENGEPALSPLQREVIYQRYRDDVVLIYPSDKWEEVSALFDRLYGLVEDYHKDDAIACS